MHIGDMAIRFRSESARSVNGENNCDMLVPFCSVSVAVGYGVELILYFQYITWQAEPPKQSGSLIFTVRVIRLWG